MKNLTEKEYELIQLFLSDNLKAADNLLFKSNLENEDFRKELEYQASLIDALDAYDKSKLKETLQENNPLKSNSVRRFRFGIILKYAAIVFLIGGIWFGFKDALFHQDINKVLLTHSSPYPPEKFERGSQGKMALKYKEAMGYYANENFEMANNLFLDLNPQNGKIILYRANCLIKIGKYKEAIVLLNSIKNTSDIKLKQNAEWYLAIGNLYLENNDGELILERIVKNPDHIFYSKAKKLLKEL